MKKFAVLVALAAFACLPVAAQAEAVKVVAGKMIYSANGKRIGEAYRVKTDGAVDLILDGHVVTIPAASFSEVGGKLTVAATKEDLLKAK